MTSSERRFEKKEIATSSTQRTDLNEHRRRAEQLEALRRDNPMRLHFQEVGGEQSSHEDAKNINNRIKELNQTLEKIGEITPDYFNDPLQLIREVKGINDPSVVKLAEKIEVSSGNYRDLCDEISLLQGCNIAYEGHEKFCSQYHLENSEVELAHFERNSADEYNSNIEHHKAEYTKAFEQQKEAEAALEKLENEPLTGNKKSKKNLQRKKICRDLAKSAKEHANDAKMHADYMVKYIRSFKGYIDKMRYVLEKKFDRTRNESIMIVGEIKRQFEQIEINNYRAQASKSMPSGWSTGLNQISDEVQKRARFHEDYETEQENLHFTARCQYEIADEKFHVIRATKDYRAIPTSHRDILVNEYISIKNDEKAIKTIEDINQATQQIQELTKKQETSIETYKQAFEQDMTFMSIAWDKKVLTLEEAREWINKGALDAQQRQELAQKVIERMITQGRKGKEILSTFDEVREYVELDKTIKIAEFSERYRSAVVSAEQMLNQADQVRIQYPNEVDQLKQYFSLHYEKVAQSIQVTKDYFDSGNFYGLDDKNLMTLDHAVTGLKKALRRIDFRVKYPTAQDVLISHPIPEDSMEYFQGFQDAHWRIIAGKRAKKDKIKFTEDYYQQYKKDLAEKSRLSDGQPLWVCRELATFEAGLDEGCVLSSIEAETKGTKTIQQSGYNPTEKFMEIAKKLYGYDSKELFPEVYFTYVSIGKPDSYYGDVAIRAKPEIKRATKVFYDSSTVVTGVMPSSLYARPVPLDEPGIDCFSLRGTNEHGDIDLQTPLDPKYLAPHNSCDPLDFKSIDDIEPFAEAHIHGGMTVDDIEEVIFFKPISDKDRREKIKGLLKKYDIKHNL